MRIGLRPLVTSAIFYPLYKRTLNRIAAEVRKEFDLLEVRIPRGTVIFLELWRHAFGIEFKKIQESGAIEIIGYYACLLDIGDVVLESRVGLVDQKKVHLKIRAGREKDRETIALWLYLKMQEVLEKKKIPEEKKEEFLEFIHNSINACVESFETEKEYVKHFKKGDAPGVLKELYFKTSELKAFYTTKYFVLALNALLGIGKDDKRVEESEKMSRPGFFIVQFLDDVSDVEKDILGSPNIIIVLSVENGEFERLKKAVERGELPFGPERLGWLRRNAPKTYKAYEDYFEQYKKQLNPYVSTSVVNLVEKYMLLTDMPRNRKK